MALICSADEAVIADPHAVPQSAVFTCNRVGPLLGTLAGRRRRAFNLLSMFVGACKEKGVRSEHALAPRYHVAHDRGVRVANVRPRVYVVNRSSNVELCAFFHCDQICGTAALGCSESLRRLAIAAADAMKTGIFHHMGCML